MSDQTDGCVRFKKSSWHYKLVSFVTASRYNPKYNYLQWADGEPKNINLCPYVRMVIACCVMLPFMLLWRGLPDEIRDHSDIAKALVIWAFICLGVQTLLWVVEFADDQWIPPPWWTMIAVYFIGIAVALGVVGIVAVAERLHNKYKHREKKTHRTRSLISSYFEAKHNKICPCVEFEDEEQEKNG